MSKLKVTTISDPDNDNTAITVSNTGAVTFAQDATFSGAINGDGSQLTGVGGGKVLQVVQTVSTGDISVASTSDTATGLIVSLTPSSSSSKFLVMLQGGMHSATVGGGIQMRTNIYRKIGSGGSYTNQGRFMSSNYYGYGPESGAHIAYLDSPATTDDVYYQIYIGSNVTDQWYLNYGSSYGTTISLIAMEIAG